MFNQQVAFLILAHAKMQLLEVNYNQQTSRRYGHCCSDASVLVAAEVRGRWRHTASAGLSSGFHASEVAVTSRSSASSPPGLQTGKNVAYSTTPCHYQLNQSSLCI